MNSVNEKTFDEKINFYTDDLLITVKEHLIKELKISSNHDRIILGLLILELRLDKKKILHDECFVHFVKWTGVFDST